MSKFAVHLHGTGCWFGTEEEVAGKWQETSPRPMGFYTMRFVDAETSDDAVAKAIELVRGEVEHTYREDYPHNIEVEEVQPDAEQLSKTVAGTGFVWYPEDAEEEPAVN